MRLIFLLLAFSLPCFAFEPWYTSTFLENAGENEPPGSVNLQIYTAETVTFGTFNQDGVLDTSVDQISTLTNVVWWEWGLTNFIDLTLIGQLLYVDGGDQGDAWFFAPSQVMVGLMFLYDDPKTWQPDVRLLLFEQFSTTPYDYLDEGKSFLAGSNGSIQTGFSFVLQKTLFLSSHPTSFNLNLNYNYQTRAHLHGVSAFGGNFNSDIKTRPGGMYEINIGIETSITQRWVLCTDINYLYFGKTDLVGNLDTFPPSVPSPASQLLTLTPGIEYNFSVDFGLLFCTWITPWGRNSNGILGVIFSATGNF